MPAHSVVSAMRRMRLVAILLISLSTGAAAGPWTIEPLSMTGDMVGSMTIQQAPDGTLYAACSRTDGSLLLAAKLSGGWTLQPSVVAHGAFTVLDREGQPWTLKAIYASGLRTLHLYHLSGGTWVDSVLPPRGQVYEGALAFDSQNRAHVAYIDTAALQLMHLRWTGDRWVDETVVSDNTFRYPRVPQMALDASDRPHFVWPDSFGSLYHSEPTSDGYLRHAVASGDCRAQNMVIDFRGHLHLSFMNWDNNFSVYHAWFDGSTWRTQVLDSKADWGSIQVDTLQRPHIVYGAYMNSVRHAAWNGWQWTLEPVTNWPGFINGVENQSLLIDANNRMHVIFTDDNRNLRYAWKDLDEAQALLSPAFDVEVDGYDAATFSLIEGNDWISTQGIPAQNLYQRGILEFDISPIPPKASVTSASLQLRVNVLGHTETSYPRLHVYGYSGDGVRSEADALNISNLIARTAEITSLGTIVIPLDPAYVDSRIGETGYLGLVVFDPYSGHQVGFFAGEWRVPEDRPQLHLTFTAPLDGDLDGDGHVDVADLLGLIDAWGSQTGDPNYNAAADVNADGYVDTADLLALVANFGI